MKPASLARVIGSMYNHTVRVRRIPSQEKPAIYVPRKLTRAVFYTLLLFGLEDHYEIRSNNRYIQDVLFYTPLS